MNKAERMLKKVKDVIGGEYWESARGVPILTIACCNISYFCKRDSFRLFIQNTQDKIDCKTYLDVINYFRKGGEG